MTISVLTRHSSQHAAAPHEPRTQRLLMSRVLICYHAPVSRRLQVTTLTVAPGWRQWKRTGETAYGAHAAHIGLTGGLTAWLAHTPAQLGQSQDGNLALLR